MNMEGCLPALLVCVCMRAIERFMNVCIVCNLCAAIASHHRAYQTHCMGTTHIRCALDIIIIMMM